MFHLGRFHVVCGGLLLILLASTRDAQAAEPDVARSRSWVESQKVELDECRVTLFNPVLVGRSSSFLWFPTLIRVNGEHLLAVMSNYADKHVQESTADIAWSAALSFALRPVRTIDCRIGGPLGTSE